MSSRIYKLGIWNQNNGNFNDSNDQLTRNVLSEAIDTNTNMIICGGRDGCSNCDNLFDSIKNLSNELNEFLKTQKIYLASCHYSKSTNVSDKLNSIIKDVAQTKEISFSGLSFSGNLAYIVYIKMSNKNAKVQSSATELKKSNVISNLGDNPIPIQYSVIFKDYDGSIIKNSQLVDSGSDAEAPEMDVNRRAGYTFTGWEPPETNITSNRTCIAQYSKNKKTYHVIFKADGKVLKEVDVDEGETAQEPSSRPSKTGYTFEKWDPTNVNIQANTTCIAQFVKNDGLYENIITKKMFYNNKSLENITLPDTIEHINESAFEGCIKLNASIPSRCKTIGARAFYGCKYIEKIHIPTTVTRIGDEAFQIKVQSFYKTEIDMTSFSLTSTIPLISENSLVNSANNTVIKFANLDIAKYFYTSDTLWKKYRMLFNPALVSYIYFDSNGGTGSMDIFIVYVNEQWYCPENKFKRDNYDFINFNSNSDGSGTMYIPGQIYDWPLSNITLYAIWKESVKLKSYAIIATYSKKSTDDMISTDLYKINDMCKSYFKTVDTLPNNTATDVLNKIKERVNASDCEYLFIYLSAHGNRMTESGLDGKTYTYMAFRGDSKLTGKDLWEKLKNAKCKIFLVIHTCHAGHVFKTVNPTLQYEEPSFEENNIEYIDFGTEAREYFNNNALYAAPANSAATNEPDMLLWTSNQATEYGWGLNSSERTTAPEWWNAMNGIVGCATSQSFCRNFDENKSYSELWNLMTRDGESMRLNQAVIEYNIPGRTFYKANSEYLRGPTPLKDVFGNFDESKKIFT